MEPETKAVDDMSEAAVLESIKTMKPLCKILELLMQQDFSLMPTAALRQLGRLLRALNKPKIDVGELSEISAKGVPYRCRGLRPLLWKLLLGYMPPFPLDWQVHLEEHYKIYTGFKKDPGENFTDASLVPRGSEDATLIQAIKKDIVRTRSELQRMHKVSIEGSGSQSHEECLGRIIYIFAKLNPIVKYLQGMNEILLVLYATLEETLFPGYEQYLESDTFFTFSLLMGEVNANYIRLLDSSSCGLKAKLSSIAEKLARFCPPASERLKTLKIEFEFFAYKWIVLLFAQDYKLRDLQCLWDSLFSDRKRFLYLQYFIVAMIASRKQDLLTGDFSTVMAILQEAPKKTPVEKIKNFAHQLYDQDLAVSSVHDASKSFAKH